MPTDYILYKRPRELPQKQGETGKPLGKMGCVLSKTEGSLGTLSDFILCMA
jgi:hypothetical protein